MTISRVFFNSLAGYALSRLQFRGRSVVFGLFIAVMTVPSVVLMIPPLPRDQGTGHVRHLLRHDPALLVDAAGIFIISRQSPELHTLTTGVGALVSGQLGSGNQFP